MNGDIISSLKKVLMADVEAIQRERDKEAGKKAAEEERKRFISKIRWVRVKPSWQVAEEEEERRRSERIKRKLAEEEEARKADNAAQAHAWWAFMSFKTKRDELLLEFDEASNNLLQNLLQDPFEEDEIVTTLKKLHPKIRCIEDYLAIQEKEKLRHLRNEYLKAGFNGDSLAQAYFEAWTQDLVKTRPRDQNRIQERARKRNEILMANAICNAMTPPQTFGFDPMMMRLMRKTPQNRWERMLEDVKAMKEDAIEKTRRKIEEIIGGDLPVEFLSSTLKRAQ